MQQMELTTQHLTSLKQDWINHRRAVIRATLVVFVGVIWAWLTFAADNPVAGFLSMVVGALIVAAGAIVFDQLIERWFEATLSRCGYTFSQLMNIVGVVEAQRAEEYRRADSHWRDIENKVNRMAVVKWVNRCNWISLVVGVILLLTSSSFAYERWKEDQPRSPLVFDAPTVEIFDGIATPSPPATDSQDPPSAVPSIRQSPIPDAPGVVPDPKKKTQRIDPGKAAGTVTNLTINTEVNAKATYTNLGAVLNKISNVDTSSPDAAKKIEDIGNDLQTAQDYLNKLEKDDLVPPDLRGKADELANSISQTQKTLSDPSKSLEDKAKALGDLASKIAEFLKLLGTFLEELGSFLDKLFGSESGLGKSLKQAGQALRSAGEKVEDMASRATRFTQQLTRQLERADGVVRILKDEWECGGGGRVNVPEALTDTVAPDPSDTVKRPRASNPSGEEVDDPTAKTPNPGSLPGPK